MSCTSDLMSFILSSTVFFRLSPGLFCVFSCGGCQSC